MPLWQKTKSETRKTRLVCFYEFFLPKPGAEWTQLSGKWSEKCFAGELRQWNGHVVVLHLFLRHCHTNRQVLHCRHVFPFRFVQWTYWPLKKASIIFFLHLDAFYYFLCLKNGATPNKGWDFAGQVYFIYLSFCIYKPAIVFLRLLVSLHFFLTQPVLCFTLFTVCCMVTQHHHQLLLSWWTVVCVDF